MAHMTADAPSAWDALADVNLPDGYRVEITDGKIIMTPQGRYQWKIILKAAPQIERQLEGGGDILSDVMIDFPSSQYGYAPDLAIIAPDAATNARGRFEWHSVEAIIEVVPESSRDNDFKKKYRLYAECEIPVYVTVDPENAICTLYSKPSSLGRYRSGEEIPFGQDLCIPVSGDRKVIIKTDGFPKPGDLA